MLSFEVCRDAPDSPKPFCKDYESEIKPWLQRKFLFTLQNQKIFQKDVVQDDKVKNSSFITWHVLSTQLRQEIFSEVQIKLLKLSDDIGKGFFDEQEEEIF